MENKSTHIFSRGLVSLFRKACFVGKARLPLARYCLARCRPLMSSRRRTFRACTQLAVLIFGFGTGIAEGQTVEQWGRVVIPLSNLSYSGNPFELEVNGTFTHSASGARVTLPGYYDGNDEWKLAFMPTLGDTWTYITSSPDADLDGVTGSFTAQESARPGMLNADPENPRKWRMSNGTYVIPMALRMNFFYESASASEWQQAVDFLADDVNGLMYDTRLQDQASSDMDVFTGDWSNHEFDLQKWRQMEARMDALVARGLGAYIMFYADDAGTPRWSGQSDTELLVIRYTVARLASYPVILWDTGIDISEYRSQSDIDWFGERLRSLDAYGHPISSRWGGGSGTSQMSGRTYDSRGDRLARIDDMTAYFESTSRPVDMADSWGEDRPSHPEKDFRPADIRRAFWKALVAGGLAGHIRGSNGAFTIGTVQSDLESENWLRLVNQFLQQKLGDTFGEMTPSPGLVSNGYCLADPARSKLVYFLMGSDDRWDTGNGGDITVQLTSVSGTFDANWFDTRSGQEISAGSLSGGTDHVITPPTSDDWILLLTGEGASTAPVPKPPGNLIVE